jgi:tetratricopeptide (TPR) repeat protein
MIAGLKPSRVAIVPAESEPTLAVGGDLVLGPAAEFTVEMTEGISTSGGLVASPTSKGPIGSHFLTEIARASLERATRLTNSVGAWTQAGFAFLAAHDVGGARHAFETALSFDPSAENAKLGLARTAHEEGRSDEAAEMLSELLSTSPRTTEIRVSLALVFVSVGRLKEALDLLDNEPSDPTKAPTLLAVRGGVRFMLNDLSGAVSDLRKAVRLKPDWVHARNILGLAELKAGHRTAAERHFRTAVRTGPMNLGAVLNLVRLLRQDQRWEEVLNVIERYWKPGPTPVDLGFHAAEACLAVDDARSARAWLEGILEKGRSADETAAILNNLGVAYAELNLTADAQKAFSDSVEASPTAIAIANFGKLLIESGDVEQAVHWLERWWATPGFDGLDLGLTLAFALMRAQRSDDAIQLAKTLTERPEASERAFALLSALQADGARNYQGAVETALVGLERWPRSIVLMNNLSYALLMSGQPEPASKWLDSINDSSLDREDRVYVTATRGLLALWSGDLPGGRRLYEAALASAGRESLRERVKAKRDLEVARAILRLGKGTTEAVALLKRAASAKPTAQPYASHAEAELRLLTSGGS